MIPSSSAGKLPDGDEITPETLSQLNAILAQSPSDDASAEEVDALIEQVCALPGGAALWESLQQQLAAGKGPLLDEVLAHHGTPAIGPDPELYLTPQSSYHLVYTIHAEDSPTNWRRFSLPTDACFYDLHFALQDAFEEVSSRPYRFEFRVGSRVEVTLGSGRGEEVFCELQNRPFDFFQEGAADFFYLEEGVGPSGYHIRFEKVIEPSGIEEAKRSHPQFIDGQDFKKDSFRNKIQFRIPSEFFGRSKRN